MDVLGWKICTPAVLYLVISLFLVLYGLFTLRTVWGFGVWAWTLIHIGIILFWTFVLNAICAYGFKWVSWILVLLPIAVVMFGYLTKGY